MGVCEPRASCLTHIYPFSIPSREGPPILNLGKCKIHFSHQGCQNWSAFPTRMMLLLRTRETGKKGTVSILSEKAMAPHSSTLAWKITWTEEPGRLQSMGSLRVGHGWGTSLSFSLSCIGEGNGNPLQCSCLENSRDGGAWWAAVYGVAQSWTRLKRLSSSSSNLRLNTLRKWREWKWGERKARIAIE